MASVLITGCSKGIGRATAVELARRGHEVVATARRPETLEGLDAAKRLALDVTDDASVAAARAAAGPVDALVNNAGEIFLGPVESMPMAEVRRLYELNVFGALRMVQAFVPAMRERGEGCVVNVSSVAGRVTTPLGGAYGSTKWALEALTEALRFEVGHYGVRVVLLEPGPVSTGALDAPTTFVAEGDPYAALAAQVGFGSRDAMSTPEEVAAAIADAVEAPQPELRRTVGARAEALLGARRALDDEAFDAALRSALGVSW